MFIELHKPGHARITINVNRIEYFVPTEDGQRTRLSLIEFDGYLHVEESYEQVKELVANATRR